MRGLGSLSVAYLRLCYFYWREHEGTKNTKMRFNFSFFVPFGIFVIFVVFVIWSPRKRAIQAGPEDTL